MMLTIMAMKSVVTTTITLAAVVVVVVRCCFRVILTAVVRVVIDHSVGRAQRIAFDISSHRYM